ncbi:MAG: invasion associated locus B family protein [Pseudomonadota bacterium]
MARLCLISLGLMVLGPDGRAADDKTFQNWSLRCDTVTTEGQAGCFVYQDLVLREDGQRVMQFAVGYVQGTNAPVALLSLPLGISLPPGAQLEIPEREPIEITIERCDPTGCRGGFRIEDELLAALLAAQTMTITFHDRNRKPIQVPLSMAGFTAGFAALPDAGELPSALARPSL